MNIGSKEIIGFGLLTALVANRNQSAIGAIHPNNPPGNRQCVDGKFTDSSGPGSCSYHGGVLFSGKKPTQQVINFSLEQMAQTAISVLIKNGSNFNYYAEKQTDDNFIIRTVNSKISNVDKDVIRRVFDKFNLPRPGGVKDSWINISNSDWLKVFEFYRMNPENSKPYLFNGYLGYNVDNFTLESSYEYFNNLLYNSELPSINLGEKNYKNSFAKAIAFVRNPRARFPLITRIDGIYFSNQYKLDNESKTLFMIHEMIHIYLYTKGIVNTTGGDKSHGKEFKEELQRIQKFIAKEIPITEEARFEFTGKGKNVDVLLYESSGKTYVSLWKPGILIEQLDILNRMFGDFKILNTDYSGIQFLTVKRKFGKFNSSNVSDDILESLLQDSSTKSIYPTTNISRNQTRGSVIPILVLAYLGYKYFKS